MCVCNTYSSCAMNNSTAALALALFFLFAGTDAVAVDYLKQCRDRQVGPAEQQFVVFGYTESRNSFYHSPEPWQVVHTKSRGSIWCNANHFLQSDTVVAEGEPRISAIQFSPAELLVKVYWKKDLLAVNRSAFTEQVFETARYSPMLLIAYFLEHGPVADTTESAFAVYTLTINTAIVRLFIRKSDALAEKVVITRNHDILGDVTDTVVYEDFAQYGQLHYARRISIRKMQNICDSVAIAAVGMEKEVTPLIENAGYSMEEDRETTPETAVEKIADNIYAINLLHAETKVGLVEFKDFFVVFDVPLSSANGELVLKEAKRIAPEKPVKYYAFGHHHPWYIGGVRPFIRSGATVLCRKENLAYVQYIAGAPRTIQPDSLHLRPMPLKTQLVDSVLTITDGSFEMKICHIGMKSAHTTDYLLFYFPSEKLVWQGDLAWIPSEGPVATPGRTQVGLYNAIKHLGLDVATIVQTWPIGEKRRTKTVFSFGELEESVKLK